MKHYIILWALLITGNILYAQKEENYWTFGARYSLDFSTSPPTLNDNHPISTPVSYRNSIAVSDASGQLLFLVRLNWDSHKDGTIDHIFNRYNNPVPNTNLMGAIQLSSPPVVIPHGGNPNQYYIFYVRDRGLFYSLFDLSLNNGLGDIVQAEKNVMISGYGTVIGRRMTAVKGCTGIWLVIRAHHANEYYSFLVAGQGLHTTPVVSECGLLNIANYRNDQNGNLDASPDGRYLATGVTSGARNFDGGLELYDFEPCSGRVKNARLLESNVWFNGVCFSPDNTKLYITQNDFTLNSSRYTGRVYQFDLSQLDLNAIINSKTLILTNPETIEIEQSLICRALVNYGLGDMKRSPDGKIYVPNQSGVTCMSAVNPLSNNPGMAFHIIHEPNNAGLTCQPIINALYNRINGMYGNSSVPTVLLPKDFIVHPKAPDTLIGTTHNIPSCFKDSTLLTANEGMECYLWDNGSTEPQRYAPAPGTYYVQYFKDCSVKIDTYKVYPIPLPEVPTLTHGCPNEITVSVRNKTNDTTTYSYKLYDLNRQPITAKSNKGYNFGGLSGGNWLLQITTEAGCDTTIHLRLEEYPVPVITTTPKDTIIYFGDTIRIRASGAYFYAWNYVSSLDTPTIAAPLVAPKKPTTYRVFGLNEYGCRAEGHVHVDIDYTMPVFIPNAFSPNGDGINDLFKIANINYQKIATFKVFNRLGQEVFFTNNPDTGWDGTYRGKSCDMGVYFYFIELVFPNGEIKAYKGDITLIR